MAIQTGDNGSSSPEGNGFTKAAGKESPYFRHVLFYKILPFSWESDQMTGINE